MKKAVGVGVFGTVVLLVLLIANLPLPSEDDATSETQERVYGDASVPPVVLRLSDDGTMSADCLALAGSPTGNSRLMIDYQQSDIRAFFESLEEQGFDLLQRQLVADLAGLDPFSVDVGYKSPSTPSYRRYLLPSPQTAEVGLATTRRLGEALSSTLGIDLWLLEIQNDPTILRHRWSSVVPTGPSFDAPSTSVLGHALRTRRTDIEAHLHELPAESFGLHELAVAIEVSLPADSFVAALERSDVDHGKSWSHHRLRRDVNLAVVAVFNARPGILRELMARGVEPSSPGHSVLDEIAVSPAIHQAPMADIVRQLAGTDDQPFFPSTIETFRRRFPSIPEMVLHPESATFLSAVGIGGTVEQLASMSSGWEEKVAEARRVEERCGQSWLAAADVSATSLVGKLRHEKKLSQQLAQVESAAIEIAKSISDTALLQFAESLGKALSADNYSDALRLIDENDITLPDPVDREELYLSVLHHALRSGAPIDVIRAVIDRTTGSLPPTAIISLVGGQWDGSVAMAADLENLLGLDVHSVDDRGRNAVSKVANGFRLDASNGPSRLDQHTIAWMDYLMSRSVATKPSPLGLDPLDSVLLAIKENPLSVPVGVHLTRLLIDNGSPIEQSHRELIDQIRRLDNDGYNTLVEGIPELVSS